MTDTITLPIIESSKDSLPSQHTKEIQHSLSTLVSSMTDIHTHRVNSLLETFIGTKDTRIGELPNGASMEMMRNVISEYVKRNEKVPVLIAASACKLPLHKAPLDMAELVFITVLMNLQKRVCVLYPIGLDVIIRIEDSTLRALYPQDIDVSLKSYIDSFQKLLYIMNTTENATDFITLKPETILMNEQDFLTQVKHISNLFHAYIQESDKLTKSSVSTGVKIEHMVTDPKLCPTLIPLHNLGWLHGVSLEFRSYLRARLHKLFPTNESSDVDQLMCTYLAAILARKVLKGTGHHTSWQHGRLEISLVPPMPDAPEVSTRVHYRSCPLSVSKCQAPFWKSVGVIKLKDKNGQCTFSMIEHDHPTLHNHKHKKHIQILRRDNQSIEIPMICL